MLSAFINNLLFFVVQMLCLIRCLHVHLSTTYYLIRLFLASYYLYDYFLRRMDSRVITRL